VLHEFVAGQVEERLFRIAAVDGLAENVEHRATLGRERDPAAVGGPHRTHVVRIGAGEPDSTGLGDSIDPEIGRVLPWIDLFGRHAPAIGRKARPAIGSRGRQRLNLPAATVEQRQPGGDLPCLQTVDQHSRFGHIERRVASRVVLEVS